MYAIMAYELVFTALPLHCSTYAYAPIIRIEESHMTAPTRTHHCNPPLRMHARSVGVEAGHVEGTLVVVESRLSLVECQLHLYHPTPQKKSDSRMYTCPLKRKKEKKRK